MLSRPNSDCFLLASSVAVSRFVLRSHELYDLDSVNFALAMDRFDPRVHQPHPPGYFLYVCLGRFLNSVVHDANLALVLLSIAASIGTVILIYRLTLDWFGLRAARFAGGLFLLSPLAWFHGTVALTYSLEAFFSAFLGYSCWRIVSGTIAWIVPAGIMLGISAGIRPSSILFLGPLFLFSLFSATPKQRLLGVASLFLMLAAWFFPMIWMSGGFHAYFGALLLLWQWVPSKNAVWNSSPATSIARGCTVGFIYMLCFGAASLAPLGARYCNSITDSRKRIFTLLWIAPALCFFTLVFLNFVNSGYLLLLSAPGCIWLGFWASAWYENSQWRLRLRFALIGVCAVVNTLIFLVSPLYCSYRSVRYFESELKDIRTALPQVGSANDMLLIGFDSHFLGYRHAGYYLPGYLTVEYPEVKLPEGTRVFAMFGRDTHFLTGLPVTSYTRFLLFPLPNGDAAYHQYLQNVKNKLPSGSLRTLRVNGHEFVTGPITDLVLLFPRTGSAPEQSVYSLLHSETPPVNSREHQAARNVP
jgi:hypothetical protein